MEGRIEIIFGPMFAGKTTEMLKRVNCYKNSQRSTVVIKYANDTRYSVDKVSTHDYITHEAIPCLELMSNIKTCVRYDVIGIDEGQFYPDIVEFSTRLANMRKIVVIAALDGSFQRKKFGSVIDLVPKADSVIKISAICQRSLKKGYFTMRTVESEELELIGGDEAYTAASRSTFMNNTTEGEINLILGPVMSGKTAELIRRLNRYHYAQRKVIMYGPYEMDPKNYKFKVLTCSKLPSYEEMLEYNVIGIDNVEKYGLIGELADKLANNDRVVIVSGRDGDSNMNSYPYLDDLLPRCEKVKKLCAVCPVSFKEAPFTYLSEKGKEVPVSRSGMGTIKYLLT